MVYKKERYWGERRSDNLGTDTEEVQGREGGESDNVGA